MPRKAIGPRPLTPAERQAHQRAKHKDRLHDAEATLGRAFRWIEANVPSREWPTDLLNEISDAMGQLRRYAR